MVWFWMVWVGWWFVCGVVLISNNDNLCDCVVYYCGVLGFSWWFVWLVGFWWLV